MNLLELLVIHRFFSRLCNYKYNFGDININFKHHISLFVVSHFFNIDTQKNCRHIIFSWPSTRNRLKFAIH